MLIHKLLNAAAFAVTLAFTTAATAEPPRLTAIREGVRELDVRVRAVRVRAEQSNNALLRNDVERIARAIEERRAGLVTRLAVVDLVGVDSVGNRTLEDIALTLDAADKLLTRVERWFAPPR